MFLPELCIKRPVFATVLSLLIVIFGYIGYQRLPTRELPDIDLPVVTVRTVLPGANPQILDEDVTDVLESELSSIEGIKHIRSQSTEGRATTTIEFVLEKDIDVAAQDVRDKVSRARFLLPDDIEEPTIEKLDLNAFAIMWLGVTSERHSDTELTFFVEEQLQEPLQRVPGVGSVLLAGGRRFAVRVWLDPDRLAARRLTVMDVARALQERNLEAPSGRIEGMRREFTIRTEGELKSLAEFERLIVAYDEAGPIRLGEVAQIAEGVEDPRGLARFGGKSAIGLGIVKQSGANTTEVAQGVRDALEELIPTMPEGLKIQLALDTSTFVQQSIDEVQQTLILACVLVALVIFTFLRNVRTTIVPAMAMPVSIVGTFAIMYFMGFSLNNFSLLGLVLAVGVVVDDAIVVVENIFRHIENGEDRLQAAIRGSREIAFAVIVSTVAIVAVFLPVAFMEGQIGRFFYEFGLTVAVAVCISTFVALTLTPMLSSRVLKKQERRGVLYTRMESFYLALEASYKNLLGKSLKRPWTIVLLGLASLALSGVFFVFVGKEFAPDDDRSSFGIILSSPDGSTLEYTDSGMRPVEDFALNNPHVETVFAAIGMNESGPVGVTDGIMFLSLTDRQTRPHEHLIRQDVRDLLAKVPELETSILTFNPFGQAGEGKTFEAILTSPDFEELKLYSQALANHLKDTPGFIEVDTDLKINNPELTIHIDRDKAAQLGLGVRDISNTLNVLLAGADFSKYKARGERYDVILQMPRQERQVPDTLKSIQFRTSSGELVDLGSFARIEEGVSASAINRYDRGRSVSIGANLSGITLDEAVTTALDYVDQQIPESLNLSLSGQAEEMATTFTTLGFTFILATIIVYLVLSAQFESFIYAISVMGALPLSIVGALGALWLSGMTLNLFSLLGMVMLLGIVSKNSILLVDYTIKLRSEGMELSEALSEAGRVRLRPILMTATSTIFGILPIALGAGAGTESRQPLGMAIVGGMISSTILTLLVVPVIFLLIERFANKLRSLWT